MASPVSQNPKGDGRPDVLRLKVRTPTRAAVDVDVRRIVAETVAGEFCLLPRHVDVVAVLVPGILAFEAVDGPAGRDSWLALDGGVLVKCGDEVLVSSTNAIAGTDLNDLERAVTEEFQARHEHDKRNRTAIEKMEADFIRRFVETAHYDHL